MLESIVIGLTLFMFLFVVAMAIGKIVQVIHYHRNYKDYRGWHKCYNCGDANELMFFEDFFWGRYHKCDECFKKEINGDNETTQRSIT